MLPSSKAGGKALVKIINDEISTIMIPLHDVPWTDLRISFQIVNYVCGEIWRDFHKTKTIKSHSPSVERK